MSGFSAVGLHNAKNSINVGHALRAAGAFDASMVAVSGTRGQKFRGFITDTECVRRRLPLLFVDNLWDVIPHNCVPIAVELLNGAKPLPTFPHPPRAFYIFGPEDGTLGEGITSWCRDVIYVPSGCLNLAACVNVVLYDRMVKRGEWARGRRAAEISQTKTEESLG